MTWNEHSAPSRRRARPLPTAGAIGIVVALVAGLAALNSSGWATPLAQPPGFLPSTSTAATPQPAATPVAPGPDVVALADRMLLTAQGRAIFYAAEPRLGSFEEIEAACAGVGGSDRGEHVTAGCFTGVAQHRDADRIFVFRPADERLHESMVTVAAHELLHAAYARMDPPERAQVDALVASATAVVPADDPVHEQIEWSVAGDEENRANEQFAYLGSQVMPSGGFSATLEAVYGLYFTDRGALVETHRRARAVIPQATAAVDAAWAEVAALEGENARARAQLDADRGAYEAALAAYEADVARFTATPPDERARWHVTLRPVGADPVTMTWEASLDYRFDELDRFRRELDDRAAALSVAEASAAQQRATAEHLRADAIALMRAANPDAEIEG
ncbi:hypothetical protein [Agrococcus sp. HG114]|uniref:hypothetical protein n=1 Tax=Agrococcus sp. HG114 TaxID=2969757 RepID=UPI00215B5E27|nr:hypothetical protein [Agrococcus sp. HG114]MCR8670507.1 hypothetical protein [Agrococcus sp. HG114]